MYRKSEVYQSVAEKAMSIYMDYGLNTFPLNPFLLCQKMGIHVYKYSDFPGKRPDLLNLSLDGFCLKSKNNNAIYYNDMQITSSRIDYTILHEIWHIVFSDSADSKLDEEEADYFAKYMKCPIPYLVFYCIYKRDSITYLFGVSNTVASFVEDNIKNRIAKFGNKLFENEIPLIESICGQKLAPKIKEKIIYSKEVMSYD